MEMTEEEFYELKFKKLLDKKYETIDELKEEFIKYHKEQIRKIFELKQRISNNHLTMTSQLESIDSLTDKIDELDQALSYWMLK